MERARAQRVPGGFSLPQRPGTAPPAGRPAARRLARSPVAGDRRGPRHRLPRGQDPPPLAPPPTNGLTAERRGFRGAHGSAGRSEHWGFGGHVGAPILVNRLLHLAERFDPITRRGMGSEEAALAVAFHLSERRHTSY